MCCPSEISPVCQHTLENWARAAHCPWGSLKSNEDQYHANFCLVRNLALQTEAHVCSQQIRSFFRQAQVIHYEQIIQLTCQLSRIPLLDSSRRNISWKPVGAKYLSCSSTRQQTCQVKMISFYAYSQVPLKLFLKSIIISKFSTLSAYKRDLRGQIWNHEMIHPVLRIWSLSNIQQYMIPNLECSLSVWIGAQVGSIAFPKVDQSPLLVLRRDWGIKALKYRNCFSS